MEQISALQLAGIETQIAEFMLDRTSHRKTYGQLLDIFESSYEKMETDPSNDLRILQFSSEMEKGNWHNGIVVTCCQGIAVDGIHRGVAYLKCIRKGVAESTLPKLLVAVVEP